MDKRTTVRVRAIVREELAALIAALPKPKAAPLPPGPTVIVGFRSRNIRLAGNTFVRVPGKFVTVRDGPFCGGYLRRDLQGAMGGSIYNALGMVLPMAPLSPTQREGSTLTGVGPVAILANLERGAGGGNALILAKRWGWDKVLARFGLTLDGFRKNQWVEIPLALAIKGINAGKKATEKKPIKPGKR